MAAWIESLLFVAWTTTAALSDLRHRRVANAWIAVGLAAAFACAFTVRAPFGVPPGQAALGALLGFAAMLPFYALRVMGAADVKAFAVLGAWCGAHALPGLWVMATVMAGLHSLALQLATRTWPATPGRGGSATFALRGHRATPYVTCLGVAALGVLASRYLRGA
ncbi:prepilin peptidase [Paraburkholderia sp. CNPSo 3157]|uniref:Prepilin peptidase n=1 Tax=Paraburkholderia franconis TaxID=2654983 RepID=A0A7X1ND99_9BURK|nr:prepilin peptidase [Paraburkholderia franconis]MPW19822.1 prepilin peptidase [Paraburkholderia franconis]